MGIFIALLRGINVSGQKIIKMATLREQLSSWGFEDVETYIQSGNLLLKSSMDNKEVKAVIQQGIRKQYGFEVPTLVLDIENLERMIENQPFPEHYTADPKKFYLTFLGEKPNPDHVSEVKTFSFPPEEFAFGDGVVYFYSPDPYGKSKMSNSFFEKKLKVFTTSRNWKTANILLEKAKKLEDLA